LHPISNVQSCLKDIKFGGREGSFGGGFKCSKLKMLSRKSREHRKGGLSVGAKYANQK
jgi:hypothetical protein